MLINYFECVKGSIRKERAFELRAGAQARKCASGLYYRLWKHMTLGE